MLYLLFEFIFIFTSINREFGLFSIDIRYFGFALGLLLVAVGLVQKANIKFSFSPLEKSIMFYFGCILICNIAWLWNGLEADKQIFTNVCLLYGYNLLAFFVFMLNKEYMSFDRIVLSICVSVLILAASLLAVYFTVDISLFLTSDEVRIRQLDSGSGEHLNLFQQNIRVSGFAEDPNYATLFCLLGLASGFIMVTKKRALLGVSVVALSAVGAALAWSRTVILGCLFITVVSLCWYFAPKLRTKILTFSLLVAVVAVIAVPFIDQFFSLQTMQTRSMLWKEAFDLFLQSPIIGNGLTSFRSYNATFYSGWLVHCHSTIWQAISEMGILGLIALVNMYKKSLVQAKLFYTIFTTMLFIVFSLNFDCSYLQILIVVLYIIPASSSSINAKVTEKQSLKRKEALSSFGSVETKLKRKQ